MRKPSKLCAHGRHHWTRNVEDCRLAKFQASGALCSRENRQMLHLLHFLEPCVQKFDLFRSFSLKPLKLRARGRHYWIRHVENYQIALFQFPDALCNGEIQKLALALHFLDPCLLGFLLFRLQSPLAAERMGLEGRGWSRLIALDQYYLQPEFGDSASSGWAAAGRQVMQNC